MFIFRGIDYPVSKKSRRISFLFGNDYMSVNVDLTADSRLDIYVFLDNMLKGKAEYKFQYVTVKINGSNINIITEKHIYDVDYPESMKEEVTQTRDHFAY